MRAFIGLFPPPPVQDELRLLVTRLKDALPSRTVSQINWTRQEQFHITLKFLGEVREDQLMALSAALRRSTLGASPFQMTFGPLGVFPAHGSPRVLWVGVTAGAFETNRLAAGIEAMIEPLGWPRESRDFHPHLTLGRIKHPLPREWKSPELQVMSCFEATHIRLLKSQLGASGPTYSVLDSIVFGSTLR